MNHTVILIQNELPGLSLFVGGCCAYWLRSLVNQVYVLCLPPYYILHWHSRCISIEVITDLFDWDEYWY